MTAQKFGQDLQVDEGWATQFGTPGIFAAIADKIDAQLAFAALYSKIGFTARHTQGNRRTRTNGSTGHLIYRDLTKTNAFCDFLHTHPVTCITITFLADLNLDGHFTVSHIGT